MLVPFNNLPATSRIWIYQSSRPFTETEITFTRDAAEKFIHNWTAHEAGLKGGVEIFFNQFIVIGVDEDYNDASGCSIDKKVNFMKQLGAELKIDFFNRMQIAYLDNDAVKLAGMHDFADRIKSGQLSDNTIMFNNLVTTMNEFQQSWKVPVRNSWMQQLVTS